MITNNLTVNQTKSVEKQPEQQKTKNYSKPWKITRQKKTENAEADAK